MSNIQKICKTGLNSKFCVILGSQWGDEGKGKLVDILADKYDYTCRFNGGNNAGHTIVAGGKKFFFHLLPSGMLYSHVKNVLGNGTVIHLPALFKELEQMTNNNINYAGRLFLSDRAHLVTSMQLEADAYSEGDSTKTFIGTTKKGIGPTYSSKMNRYGLRVGDLKNWDLFQEKYMYMHRIFKENFQKLQIDTAGELKELKQLRERILTEKMITDTVLLLAIQSGQKILAEGANALMLDIDYGTYPYVTSSNTSIGGVCTGMGVSPKRIETVIGICKAYTTRVGEGPFPTELTDAIGEELQNVGREWGVTTGRKRRCGWLDMQVIKYGNFINQYTSLNLTKLDVMSGLDEVKIGLHYKINGKRIDYMPSTIDELAKVEVEYLTLPGWKTDIAGITDFNKLPKNAQSYIKKIEEISGIPVSWVGTGAERESIALQNV